MKIALLLPANVIFCPYASIYTSLLDSWNIKYDIICWDRIGATDKADFVFHKNVKVNDSLLKKIYCYFKYICFLKQCIKREKYDKLIVFTSQLAIFLYPFLNKYYQNKFILDFRDLSIEQVLMNLYERVLSLSSLNAISSPAFQKYLPKGFNYVISHNMNESLVENILYKKYNLNEETDKLYILTIGAIRNREQNIELMNALANNHCFQMNFVGKGHCSDSIKEYASEHNILNTYFIGLYQKEEEAGYVENCSFMNIYFPHKKSHDTALSNRFYNALFFCKPMIVTKNTIQGDLVEKYGVGIAIDNCIGLADRLIQYYTMFDFDKYMRGRNQLLSEILKQQEEFRSNVSAFIK